VAEATLLREIHEHIQARNPNVALGTEILNDVVSQYADFMHNIVGGTTANSFVEWFRYTFPEIIVSDREIRDDTDIERRVNHALLLGLRSDVALSRHLSRHAPLRCLPEAGQRTPGEIRRPDSKGYLHRHRVVPVEQQRSGRMKLPRRQPACGGGLRWLSLKATWNGPPRRSRCLAIVSSSTAASGNTP
jgi:hypothetical protein